MTLDELKRELFGIVDLTDQPRVAIDKSIDHLHAKGLLNVWNYDMDSAPISNGSKTFLVMIPGHGEVVAYRLENGQFFNASKQLGGGQAYLKPTAWMPLPKLPNNTK